MRLQCFVYSASSRTLVLLLENSSSLGSVVMLKSRSEVNLKPLSSYRGGQSVQILDAVRSLHSGLFGHHIQIVQAAS